MRRPTSEPMAFSCRPIMAAGYLRSQASKVDALSHSMSAAANHVATACQVALPHHKGFWDHMLQAGPNFAAGVTGRAFVIIGRQAVTAALEILDEALEIGKRASLPEQVVIARLKAAKRTASQ